MNHETPKTAPPHDDPPHDDLPPAPGPDAALLAELLSTAVRVEPELMRAVRLDHLPHADVGAESDLWFSHWVVSHSASAMVLVPAVRDKLRADLGRRLARCRDGDPLLRLGATIERFHRHASPLVRLEERATWRALGADEGALADAEEELRPALYALAEERRSGVADWLLSAWPRLPRGLLGTVTGWQLGSVVAHLDRNVAVDRTPPRGLTRAHAATALDAMAAADAGEVPDVLLPVRLRGGVLTVGGAVTAAPGTLLIPIPATEPVVLELRTGTSAGSRDGDVLLVPSGGTVSREGCPPQARLVTACNEVYDPSGWAHGLVGPLADPLSAPFAGVKPSAEQSCEAEGRRPGAGTSPDAESGTASAADPAHPVVLVGRRPVATGYPQLVYDTVLVFLETAGYRVRGLDELHRGDGPGEGTRPESFHAAVVLLDPVEISSPLAREQLDTLFSWCGTSGPRPLLVALDGVSYARTRHLVPTSALFRWLPDSDGAVRRDWSADYPRSTWHAREVACWVMMHVYSAVAASSVAPGSVGRVPSPDEMLARTASQYLDRYGSTGDPDALRRALDRYERLAGRVRPTEPSGASVLTRFARALYFRAAAGGDGGDADRAVGILWRVLDELGDGTAQESRVRAGALRELLRVLGSRMPSGAGDPSEGGPGGPGDMTTRAVALGRETLAKVAPGDERAELVACLIPLAADIARRSRDPEQFRWAAGLCLETAEAAGRPSSFSSSSVLSGRVAAARNAADLAFEGGSLELALRGFGRFLDLAEELDWAGPSDAVFSHVTEGFAGTPENAAACAVAVGEPFKALELLERGLRLHRVILARRALGREKESTASRQSQRRRLRREAARLLSPRLSRAQTLASAGDGPVVVLNVSAVRSDALVVSGDAVTTVALPDVDHEFVRLGYLTDGRLRAALKPAMDEVRRRLPDPAPGAPAWVWWCPTGPMSELPVHEAFPLADQPTVPEVISSYATGPAMLLEQRRSRIPRRSTRSGRALAVVSDAGEDQRWARLAQDELAAVCGSGTAFDVLRGAAATRAAVLEALSHFAVVHLVCRLVPSPGGGPHRARGAAIALADGLLTATDLAAADLGSSELVFLSGYGEAVGSGTEPDRDTLAAALHTAGCRHVVAALGTVPGVSLPPDDAGARAVGAVAARVYAALSDDARRPQPDRVPRALHRATAAWAVPDGPRLSLIHIGP